MKYSIILFLFVFMVSSCGEADQTPKPGSETKPAAKAPTVSPDDFLKAAVAGDLKAVKLAIDEGMQVDISGPDRRTALMVSSFHGHIEVVKALINAGAKVGLRDEIDRTALMYASTGNFPETVEFLIEKGSPVNAFDSGEQWTALMFAGAEGQGDVVNILLKNGADPTMKDTDGDTAGSFARKNGHTAVAEMLREAEKKWAAKKK